MIAAAPLAVLPAKFAWEALRHGLGTMTDRENIFISTGMVLFCYIMAIVLPNVGSVIAITGATVNPFIAYIFPIMFYLKLDDAPNLSLGKVCSYLVLLGVIMISLMGFMALFN